MFPHAEHGGLGVLMAFVSSNINPNVRQGNYKSYLMLVPHQISLYLFCWEMLYVPPRYSAEHGTNLGWKPLYPIV